MGQTLHGKTGTEKKQERFIREKKKARQEAEEAARIREQEEQDVLPLPPVDPETGEYQVPDYDLHQFLKEDGVNRIILPQADVEVPDEKEDFER